jgi:hypothetical protein
LAITAEISSVWRSNKRNDRYVKTSEICRRETGRVTGAEWVVRVEIVAVERRLDAHLRDTDASNVVWIGGIVFVSVSMRLSNEAITSSTPLGSFVIDEDAKRNQRMRRR